MRTKASRRAILKRSGIMAGAGAWGDIVNYPLNAEQRGKNTWLQPDEGHPHERTWMAFGASRSIWGRSLLPEVRRNLATIAKAIARFEPVTMLVRPEERAIAEELVGDAAQLAEVALDDLWIRDTGPVFVVGPNGEKAAIDFNFNGWGGKQRHRNDAKVAEFVAKQAGVPILSTDLVLEGGGIEVDGEGTAVVAESCVLNRNRNPGLSKSEVEDRLMPLLGLESIIWLPGLRGWDITDGHTDFYARFVRPGVIVAGLESDPDSPDYEVTRRNREILESATDARGRRLEVLLLESPEYIRPRFDGEDFAAGYVGFYVCNGGVILQEFGDQVADRNACEVLRAAFPNREIVQIPIDGIAAGGGSVHCATQQKPRSK